MPTNDAAILFPNELTPHDRGNGVRTIPLVSRNNGSTSLINGITEFDPSTSVPLHKHNCEESVMVLEGDAIVEIDGEQHHLSAQDTTWLPANLPHRFINASNTNRMRIFWTYASIDATRTNMQTGEEGSIDAEREGVVA